MHTCTDFIILVPSGLVIPSMVIHMHILVIIHVLVDWMVVHPEVCDAVASYQPVVALETTIVTHGMPYPENVETALEVEEMVQRGGATPATIGVLEGRVHVG